MHKALSIFASLVKLIAILSWLPFALIALTDLRHFNFEACSLFIPALLSIMPNRWFIFRPWIFVTTLVILILPLLIGIYLDTFVYDPAPPNWGLFDWKDWVMMIGMWSFIVGIVPFSIALSFLRQRMGKNVTYT